MTTNKEVHALRTATISVGTAAALIKAAQTSSTTIGFVSAIADRFGWAFERTDRCALLAADVAIQKAWTAAAFGLTTHTCAAVIENPKVAQLAHRPNLWL